jgi:hypothetical protein
MAAASRFFAISIIFFFGYREPVKAFKAPFMAILRAEDPAIPDPMGAAQSVVKSNPHFGE